ncbi:MAG: SMI1/KNR4 family protein [Pseudanabaena sp. ELA645]
MMSVFNLSMNNVNGLNSGLIRIQNYLQAHRSDFFALLQDGLALSEIRVLENTFHLVLPTEVIELYRWRNGAKTYHEQFRPGYRFVPLQEALEHRIYISIDDDRFSMPEDIDKSSCLLPIFAYDHESLSVLCREGDIVNSQMFSSDGCSGLYMYASSLTNLLKVMADCFEIGIYSFETYTYEQRFENAVLQKYQPELVEMALVKVLQAEKEMSGDFMGDIAVFVGVYGDIRAVEVLVRILFLSHDKYTGGYRIEIGAALALGYISSSTSIDALILALQSPYECIRDAASNPLIQICGSNAIPLLVDALKIKNEFVNNVIQKALALSCAIDELIVASFSEDDYVRLSVAKTLGRIARSIHSHIMNLGQDEPNPEREREIAKLSKQLDQVCFALIRMARDPVIEVRSVSENSLKQFRKSESV